MADAQDRNLPASERKIRKAREEGQVARSRDLAHLAAVGAITGLLMAFAPELLQALRRALAGALRFDAGLVANPAAMGERLGASALQLTLVLLPLGALVTLVALGAGVAAGGWNFSWQALAPKASKLNPIAGIGRMFSWQQLGETLKACLLSLLLGAIGALYLKARLPELAAAVTLPLPAALSQAASTLAGGLTLLLLALAAFALVDVPLQRFLLMKRLRMSVKEMKQENKDVEGNVEVKAKIRARMREMANRRMLAAVPRADLVVMNPTHYAVALKYEESKMAAPRVVAKGADLMALRIRDAAQAATVPVLQAPALARALHAHCEVDQEVPAALFGAVAQVLAYVYQLRRALAGRGAMPAGLPELNVPAELDPATRHAAQGV